MIDNNIKRMLKSILPMCGLVLSFLLFVGTFTNFFPAVLGSAILGAVVLAFIVLVVGVIVGISGIYLFVSMLIKIWENEGESKNG